MKKVSLWIHIPLGLLVKWFSFFKGQRIKPKLKIKGPAITLSNHTSFYDFLYTYSAIYPRRSNYLAAMKMFYQPFLKGVLNLSHAIPKALLQTDTQATIKTFRVLKRNGILSIFPEGQISMTGVFMPPNHAVAKLIKKAGVDVYFIKHHNAYMVNPPWTRKSFRGRIITTIEKYDKADIKNDSVDLIYQKVVDHLSYDPYLYNQIHQHKYRLNDIAGLEHICYTCPSCLYEGLNASKHDLVCPSCLATYRYDQYGKLGQTSISDFVNVSRQVLIDAYQENHDYQLSSPCQLQMFRDKKIKVVGQGIITLNYHTYHYHGTIDGTLTDLYFDPKDISSMPSDIGLNIQIYQGYQLYQFILEKPYMPTKFVLFGEYLHDLKKEQL